jgi:hypothetical protein
MALRGTVDNFGLAGVFQLIGQTSRHGVLTVDYLAEQVNLFFAGGQLVRVEGTGQGREELLGGMLVRAQVIDQQQLQHAISQGEQQHLRPLELLMTGGLVDAATVAQFAHLHSTETVHRIFAWRHGNYAFLPATSAPAAAHPAIRAEHLLMEALSQADAWPTLRQRVPHFQLVFSVVRSLEDYLVTASMRQSTRLKSELDDAFDLGEDDGASQSDDTGGISHAERTLYALIDGERDVQQLIDQSRLGTFGTVRALAALVDAELIKQSVLQQPRPTLQHAPPTQTRPVHLALGWRHLAGHGLRLAACSLALLALVCSGRSPWQPAPPTSLSFVAQPLERLIWDAQAPAIMQALEVYKAQTGSYPTSLVSLTFPGRRNVGWYRQEGVSYRLRRPFQP